MTQGSKFPDSIPDLHNISSYKLNSLEFGKTSLKEFKKLTNYDSSEKIKNVTIVKLDPQNADLYKKIRVGFKNGRLDWIEFALNNEIKMSDIVNTYGQPKDINTTYSKILNYYDYSFFNISTDKKNTVAKHITIFEVPKLPKHTTKDEPAHTIAYIPGWKYLQNGNFMKLRPGYTLETDFNAKFPFLTPYQKDLFDTNTLYIMDKELGSKKTDYKNIKFCFNNSLLSWISITPNDLPFASFVKVYPVQLKKEALNPKYSLYSNNNFVLVINNATKKITNIGIIYAQNQN